MLRRLKNAKNSDTKVSGGDANFYFHKVAEAIQMNRDVPYKAAYQATLKKYDVHELAVHQPEVIQQYFDSFNRLWTQFWK